MLYRIAPSRFGPSNVVAQSGPSEETQPSIEVHRPKHSQLSDRLPRCGTRWKNSTMMKYLPLLLAVLTWPGFANLAEAAGDIAAGKAKAASCAVCHGANGQGVPPNPA